MSDHIFANGQVDVFSFGIVLWEILTGEEPYANMHYGAIIGLLKLNLLSSCLRLGFFFKLILPSVNCSYCILEMEFGATHFFFSPVGATYLRLFSF